MDIKVVGGSLPKEELEAYIEMIKSKHPYNHFKTMVFTVNDDYVDIEYTFEAVPFERIRRITGYLVGTVDRFNDAKRKEVEDRVSHLSMSKRFGD